MSIINLQDIAIDLCGNHYLEPYIKRQLQPDSDEETEALTPRCGVRIMTDDTLGDTDQELDAYSQTHGIPLVTLHCPYIVGTGMQGLPYRIAAGIYKGTFVHIRDNQARISVVHAVDVARAIEIAAGLQDTYTLTDTTDPTIHDLAEAFAYRLGDKRLFVIKPSWARLWYGKLYYQTLTTDHVSQSTFTEIFPEFHPVTVTDYLRTHTYDESSL